eukprot:Lankesteria_metandrocarpae@DN4902_c0_g1_i3.p1
MTASTTSTVVLVTGGRGLLGRGLKAALHDWQKDLATARHDGCPNAGTDNPVTGTDNPVTGTENPVTGTDNTITGTDNPSDAKQWFREWSSLNVPAEEGKSWLAAEFYWASTIDGDLRDYTAATALFNKVRPTHVVHLAARVGGLFANMAGNIEFMRDNIQLNDNILRLCHEHKVRRAIFCLSTCVFPPDAPLPIKETSLHEGPPHFSNEGYAMAKRVLECMTRFYRQTYGYSWVCVCPTNLYGPHDNYNLEAGHVLPAMLHRCLLAKHAQKPFVVMGTGKPLRQFLYSEDAGRFLLSFLAAQSDSITECVYNLCPNEEDEVSIEHLAHYVATQLDYVEHITWDTTKADGVYRKTASNASLRAFLKIEQLHVLQLHTGVKLTADWFQKAFADGTARL